ncbi:hypothetical protein QQZ08_011179 [Neonectria magnoliae]|uniref:MYND-type zinc finger protein samB n=1 Tax=Neonectria magnoliae TaxID=2732573 RepID=A0ABR1HCC1_9HYPO
MSSSDPVKMVTIREVPGKGKGLVAAQKIPKGTRLLSEEPIIRIPEDAPDNPSLRASIRRQVESLTDEQRRSFLDMHNTYPGSMSTNSPSHYLGIIRTNALPMDDTTECGIFLSACRINHACDNNAQKGWNEAIKRHTIHALRDIDKDEEITISYLGVIKNRKARQEDIQRKFGFTCSCRLCSLPPHLSAESDRRLDEILKLDGLIGKAGVLGTIITAPKRVLRHVDQQIQLYNEQGPSDAGLSRAFFDAAQIAAINGDLARARVFAERAASAWLVAEGADNPIVLKAKAFAQDPSTYDIYGFSTAWKTSVDDIPHDLDATEFEDWLWRREKRHEPGQPVDLRNRATFPSFMELPDENDVDEDFFKSNDGVNYKPRRHWCFLAEIVDYGALLRLQMTIKDVSGETLPLFFHTDGRGGEISPSQTHKGYTVAILYAQQHAFAFSEPGIRHEDPPLIKIFPISLDNLLALSDRVQRFSSTKDQIRTCHGCDKRATCLKNCARCSMFWYCDADCQKVGWLDKGHKADCKLLQDGDLKGLFSLNWDEFQDFIKFPLRP